MVYECIDFYRLVESLALAVYSFFNHHRLNILFSSFLFFFTVVRGKVRIVTLQ